MEYTEMLGLLTYYRKRALRKRDLERKLLANDYKQRLTSSYCEQHGGAYTNGGLDAVLIRHEEDREEFSACIDSGLYLSSTLIRLTHDDGLTWRAYMYLSSRFALANKTPYAASNRTYIPQFIKALTDAGITLEKK